MFYKEPAKGFDSCFIVFKEDAFDFVYIFLQVLVKTVLPLLEVDGCPVHKP